MRQALGLRDGPQAQRPAQKREAEHRGRRFVKDGEVPVVVLNNAREPAPDTQAPVNRLAAAEASLRQERTAREQVERALHEAQALVQHLQTQLAHADMAHKDEIERERHAKELAEAGLRDAIVMSAELEAQLAGVRRAGEVTPRPKAVRKTGGPVGRPRKIVEVPTTPEEEPEPVKWWLFPPKKARR